jgi:hypothetical protein
MAIESLFKIGKFLIIIVGLKGNHGDTVIGMHGIGAPKAAATMGFAMLMHIAKGMMFSSGI